MFKFASTLAVLAGAASASHLDNGNGMFDSFDFDSVKFKTRTNCSLDKYPEVSHLINYPLLTQLSTSLLPPIYRFIFDD